MRVFPVLVCMNKSQIKIIIIAAVVGALALGSGIWLQLQNTKPKPGGILMQDNTIILFAFPKTVAGFSLLDHQNRIFNSERFRGKWTFIFFGYSHCPDICPSTLFMMSRVQQKILKKHSKDHNTQFVFVSVDPERDTPERLGKYLPNFSKTFIGVSGKEKQLKKLTQQFGVAYELVKTSGKKNYLVNHTAAVFLVGPKGRYRALFTSPHNPTDITVRFSIVRQLK